MSDISRTPDCEGVDTLLVAPLQCFSGKDLERVGGKAANLGLLIQAGFPVPAGFVVTTGGYDRFINDNDLGESIAHALSTGESSGAAIREAFTSGKIPPELERNIREAYQRQGSGPVAVRSSATAEDLPEAAFAGQQDTFLNVIGEEQLLDAVRRCWASLWTERAIAYRQRQGIGQQAVKLAVVVQRMADAQAAGVMFTANPVTGARDELVIDASPGLGEAVVSGLVTPEHFTLQKRRWGWRITGRQAGRGEVEIRALPGGGTERVDHPASPLTAHAPVLPARALFKLAYLGGKIQRLFGNTQDIEWAWTGREMLILQARPITALPEQPLHPSKTQQMLSGMFAEMFPVRPYPLDQTTWVPAISEAAVVPIFSMIGIAAPPIEQLFTVEDGVMVRMSDRLAIHPTPAILLAPARVLWLSLRYDPLHWREDPLLTSAQAHARALETAGLQELSWEELLEKVQDALALARPLAGEIRGRYYPRAILSAGLLGIALGVLGYGNRLGALLSGTDSTTSESNHALERLATEIRSEPVLESTFANHAPGELRAALEQQVEGRKFLADFDDFLDHYGHREIVFSTVLMPTWKDAPETVLGMLQGLALSEMTHETGLPEWELARDEMLALPVLQLPPLRAAFLGLLTTARCLWQIRESTHFEATRIMPILRSTLLEIGQRLTDVGVLDAPADVFHLKIDELKCVDGIWPPSAGLAAQLRETAGRRKALRATLEATPLVNPQLYQQLNVGGDALLRGTAGSPGIAEGPVRVVHDASEFGNLRAGEVLVAPYTNPSWTPLFQRAAAVVVDGGAAGSHAAIVAREYGVPAVMGTVNGTQTLHDGEWVRVDGNRGIVQPAQPPMPEIENLPGR